MLTRELWPRAHTCGTGGNSPKTMLGRLGSFGIYLVGQCCGWRLYQWNALGGIVPQIAFFTITRFVQKSGTCQRRPSLDRLWSGIIEWPKPNNLSGHGGGVLVDPCRLEGRQQRLGACNLVGGTFR